MARAANENENMKMDGELTDTKNLEKNTFRTSDSSDFGSHSQNMVAQEAPAIDASRSHEFGGEDGESAPGEEAEAATQLVASITSSSVTKCNSLSDNSDNVTAAPFA